MTESDLRIAYVTPYDDEYRSITAHTRRRFGEWERRGAIVSRFVLGPGDRGARPAIANLFADIACSSRLAQQVAAFEPSVIYARWLAPVAGLHARLSSIAPLVLDIHADDVSAVARRSFVRRLYFMCCRGEELKSVAGATFVVGELAQHARFDLIGGPRDVFMNGSWLSRRAESPDPPLRVGLSTGGVNHWTGLDRLSELAEQLHQCAEWVVVCPQAEQERVSRSVGKWVQVVGTSSEAEYVAELSTWSLALGTLALERAGLRTASPLKVRDYLGLGVPMILPYWDEGLAGIEHELVLKLAGRHEAPVEHLDPEIVQDFIRFAHGRTLPYDITKLGTGEAVEARRIEFLRQFGQLP